ncbi:MAG: signal peptidase I [Lachnospiraceae bacterium]|nr:signal peptidase I [Lachnospiraceae bacterium]
MRLVRLIAKGISIALTIVLAVVLGCNLYTIVKRTVTGETLPTVFGYATAIVISGSMSGEIEVDDLVIIHRQDSYAIDQIITFEAKDKVVTHRIVGETADGFVTKGDANNTEDEEPVQMDRIIGRVVMVVPQVGKYIEQMRSPLGMLCMVLIGFLLIELPGIGERYLSRKQRGGSGDEHRQKENESAKKE